ncbi:hypothetical protein [Agilicoccus flavus]|uniref:hypothetical protein n=1 Tax=Agilicoccus flavus TaxID=2775968 RepID=UPI001CF70530|nr:hypothetical protein [Agilicoccus flavus]
MSVQLHVAAPARGRDLPVGPVVGVSGLPTAQEMLLSSRRRGPGAHREPGSTPWRTGVRELVLALTFGRLEVYRPAHRVRVAH